jgi:hypothetical protein
VRASSLMIGTSRKLVSLRVSGMFGMMLMISSKESKVNSPAASTFWYISKNEIAMVGIIESHEKNAVIDAPSFFWDMMPMRSPAVT